MASSQEYGSVDCQEFNEEPSGSADDLCIHAPVVNTVGILTTPEPGQHTDDGNSNGILCDDMYATGTGINSNVLGNNCSGSGLDLQTLDTSPDNPATVVSSNEIPNSAESNGSNDAGREHGDKHSNSDADLDDKSSVCEDVTHNASDNNMDNENHIREHVPDKEEGVTSREDVTHQCHLDNNDETTTNHIKSDAIIADSKSEISFGNNDDVIKNGKESYIRGDVDAHVVRDWNDNSVCKSCDAEAECTHANNHNNTVTDSPAKSPSSTRKGKGLLVKRLSSMLATIDFSSCDTDTCVRMIHIPSIKVYTALNKKIKESDRSWIEGFLEHEGLSTLLDTVDTISSKRVQLSEALLLLECINCVKGVLNNKVGLEYIIQNKECLKKLTKGEYYDKLCA